MVTLVFTTEQKMNDFYDCSNELCDDGFSVGFIKIIILNQIDHNVVQRVRWSNQGARDTKTYRFSFGYGYVTFVGDKKTNSFMVLRSLNLYLTIKLNHISYVRYDPTDWPLGNFHTVMTPQSKCFIIYLKNPLKVNFTERINYVELSLHSRFLQYLHLLVSLQLHLLYIFYITLF